MIAQELPALGLGLRYAKTSTKTILPKDILGANGEMPLSPLDAIANCPFQYC